MPKKQDTPFTMKEARFYCHRALKKTIAAQGVLQKYRVQIHKVARYLAFICLKHAVLELYTQLRGVIKSAWTKLQIVVSFYNAVINNLQRTKGQIPPLAPDRTE